MTKTVTTVLESLNEGLRTAMRKDPNVILLGEDILDPYGGAFKVTKGCSTEFPERVFTTPISEAAMLGIANGLAMSGKRPVVEIMFGDFITLAMDQILNHASKFHWMYNESVDVPLVVRTPMGGRRGYGPTHSQSLEKHFLGIPGLTVIAPNSVIDAGDLLGTAILESTGPILFVEHKLLYTSSIAKIGQGDWVDFSLEVDGAKYPTATLGFSGVTKHHCTIATYGYNLELAKKAAVELAYNDEIFCEIIVLSQLSPFDLAAIEASLKKTKKLVTIEEAGLTLGWGSEVIAQACEGQPDLLVKRVAAIDLPIGNSKALEDVILPSEQKIVQSIREMLKLN